MTGEIGPWSAADAEPLFDIYRRIFGDQKAEARRSSWVWQYEDNPESPQQPVVWVARRNGRAVGQVGSMPVCMWWGDREIRASWGLDYFVAPEAEGLGDSITLMRAWMQRVDLALVLGLAPTSYLICKRLGFRDLGYVPLFQAVLDPAAIVRRRWGGVAGAVAAPFSSASMWVVRRRRGQISGDPEVAPAGEIGAEYDELWQRARAGFAMCVRRDAAFVRWRYRRAPNKRYDILEARRSGELVGFVVSREEDYQGIRLGWIVDLFAARGDGVTRDALIASVMSAFTRAGVARAQAFCTCQRLAADLRRHHFFNGVSHAHLVARPNGVSEAPTLGAGDWHVVHGDSDSDR
jgi:hypothetical protein